MDGGLAQGGGCKLEDKTGCRDKTQLLAREVDDQAPPRVDLAKNTNLRGPRGGCCREWRCLDDADVIIDGAQFFSKGVGDLGWQSRGATGFCWAIATSV
uniref:Uncharacterized protein n=1 Tax=Romanomermis culicivorax TaxID=13658 RepID=A0A915ILV2_ROMCU